MRGLTEREHTKLCEINGRLGNISSPVLRLQVILQYSQIVDMMALGATDEDVELKRIEEIDRLSNIVIELEQRLNGVSDDA